MATWPRMHVLDPGWRPASCALGWQQFRFLALAGKTLPAILKPNPWLGAWSQKDRFSAQGQQRTLGEVSSALPQGQLSGDSPLVTPPEAPRGSAVRLCVHWVLLTFRGSAPGFSGRHSN